MNLAQSKARDVTQQDVIGHRSSVIPENRNTRAPALETYASLASARRGNGGAQELMRTLGIVQRATSDFQEYAQNAHAQREGENIAQGAADQHLGTVDPAMMEKSEGYRNAVTKGRTISFFNDAVREFDPELTSMIDEQNDPDLGVRQSQVKERIEQFYHDFALDPETGKPKDFMQSPGAMRYLVGAIGQTRAQFEAAAMERIEGRFNAESRANAGKNVVDQMRTSGTLDLGLYQSLLPKTVTEAQARETLLNALPEGARALWEEKGSIEGLRVYDAILGKPRALQPDVAAVPDGNSPPAPSGSPQPSGGRVSFHQLASAVKWQESRGDPNAVSPKGAVGTMQTMGDTLRDPGFGVRPAKDNSPEELERVGRDYLKAMLSRYNGDLVLALSAYNAGPGRADDWKAGMAGKSMAQKIAMIPFAETQGYVQAVLGRAGMAGGAGGGATAPDDPVQATPNFRLARPNADPVTAYEQSGDVPALVGADKLGLSAEDLGKLREERDQLANRIRVEWTRKTSEEQEFNATGLALRLYGQGKPVTSVDITRAMDAQAVSPQQGMQLYGILRQNANAAQSYSDHAEAKAREQQAAAISGRYIGAILSGRMSGPQARSAVLAELPTIRDPRVQASVANSVLATSGDIETLRANSEPVRNTLREIDDLEDTALGMLKNSYRGQEKVGETRSLLDQARTEFGRVPGRGVGTEGSAAGRTRAFEIAL